MRRYLTESQLNNVVAECVNQVIAESHKPMAQRPQRRVMNEAQMRQYIQDLINEELENEWSWKNTMRNGLDAVKDAANHAWNQGLKGSLDAGRKTFTTQQQQDNDIETYNQRLEQWRGLLKQKEALQAQIEQINQQMKNISFNKGMNDQRVKFAKKAGRAGKTASQMRQAQ